MPNIQLAKNLITLRKSNRLTQDQLSLVLNISRQAYSNYETGNRMPDLGTLIVLSQYYKVTLDELVNHSIGSEVNELKGPYTPGLTITNGDTLYLTEEETDLILKYRNLSQDNRKILYGFCSSEIPRIKGGV